MQLMLALIMALKGSGESGASADRISADAHLVCLLYVYGHRVCLVVINIAASTLPHSMATFGVHLFINRHLRYVVCWDIGANV